MIVGRGPDGVRRLRLKRSVAMLGALLFVIGLFWYLRNRTAPGDPVQIVLTNPKAQDVLLPGRAVEIRGTVRLAAGPVICNGRKAATGDGRFRVVVDGPRGPGLFVVDCHAKNQRGRTYHFRFGRLAGWTAPLTQPMERAMTLTVPLSLLSEEGGLLDQLDEAMSQHLLPLLTTGKVMTLGPYRIGPVWLGGIHVRSISTSKSGRVDFHLALDRPCLHVGTRATKGKDICMPFSFDVTVGLSLSNQGRPVLHMGKVDTERIRSSAWMSGFDLAATVAALFSKRLSQAASWPADVSRKLTGSLDRSKRILDDKLSALALMVPAVPRGWSGAGTRICWRMSLAGLDTDPERDTATVSARATIVGYDPDGTCKKPKAFAAGQRRFIPSAPQQGGGRDMEAMEDTDALLVLSSEFIDAYLAAVWASGSLRRVALDSSKDARFGFAIEALEMNLPPVFVPGQYLRMVFPEAGVMVRTLGEPKRFFVLSARMDLRLLLGSAGIELALMDDPLPLIALRCVGELGRSSCADQTRRYQSMVNMVLSMVRAGRLVLPVFPVAKGLPAWRTKYTVLTPVWVRRWEDGIGIGITVEPVGKRGGARSGRPSPRAVPQSAPPVWSPFP